MVDPFVAALGVYGGMLAASFLGSVAFLPIPYELPLLALSVQHNPWLLALLVACGATAGKTVVYGWGAGGRRLLGRRRLHNLEFARRVVGKYGPLAILIIAASPIADDPFFIAFGMVRYSLPTFVISCFAGKLILTTAIVLAGRFGLPMVGWLVAAQPIWVAAVSLALVPIVVYATLKVDWERLFLRMAKQARRFKPQAG